MVARRTKFAAIGTRWTIDAQSDLSNYAWQALMTAIQQLIGEFDRHYSRFREDSLVAAMAERAGEYDLPPDGPALLEFYRRLYDATGGLVTPLIGQVMSDAGYDAQYSLRSKPLTAPPAWDEVLKLEDGRLTLRRPALLDFGAAGKGYLIDLVGAALRAGGVATYAIDAGGDIRHYSARGERIRIGLENPLDTHQAIGVAQLGSRALAASSGARRQWGHYHHIISPVTLEPVRTIAATWVMARTALEADGLATALFFVTPSELRPKFDFDYAVLHDDMYLEASPGFTAEFFKEPA